MFQPPFVSYSQNSEDVLLWRALKGVARGFYVDVGAQDPVKDSVTKAFYERGWRGINIEPVQYWHRRLVEDRPHDINLHLAASNSPGTMRLFEVQDSGLSTSDHQIAHQHEVSGYKVQEHTVACTTLDEIFADHHVETVHFLKIDCEGAEKAVLEGISLNVVRPWIILVEATKPNSTEPAWQEWEDLLTGRGYEFAYFDGLNRYYLAKEHMNLASAYTTPVNVFDSVHLASEVEAREHIERLRTEIDGLRGAAMNAELRKELEVIVAERNAAAALRDTAVADRDEAMGERDDAMAARGTALAERDEAIMQRDEAMAARVTALAERDEAMRQRDEAMAARGTALAERDEAIVARDEALAERNHAYASRDELFAEHRECLGGLARMIAERDAAESARSKVAVQWDEIAAQLSQMRDEINASRTAFATLQASQFALLSSRSWHITAPLRACSTTVRLLYRRVRRALYLLIRPLAHAAKPGLRWLAQNKAIRTLATTTLGRHSRLTEHARLFLFGAVTAASATRAMQDCVAGDADGMVGRGGETTTSFDLDSVMERIRKEVVGHRTDHVGSPLDLENEGHDGSESRHIFLPDFGNTTEHKTQRNSEDEFAGVMERIRAEVTRHGSHSN